MTPGEVGARPGELGQALSVDPVIALKEKDTITAQYEHKIAALKRRMAELEQGQASWARHFLAVATSMQQGIPPLALPPAAGSRVAKSSQNRQINNNNTVPF